MFYLLVELLLHTATAIRHFRKNDMETAVSIMTWTTIQNKFSETLNNISSTVEHIQKLLEAQNITQLNLQLRLGHTQARLAQSMAQMNLTTRVTLSDEVVSCNTLPFSVNPSFYGREDIIDEISRVLNFDDDAPGIQSMAIWGTGGIGKTQIALEFANLQLKAGIPAIIWISSETEAEVSKSFTEAASQLKLPDYKSTNTPYQNRLLVLQWLQKTSPLP